LKESFVVWVSIQISFCDLKIRQDVDNIVILTNISESKRGLVQVPCVRF